jgi:hypothetical protein
MGPEILTISTGEWGYFQNVVFPLERSQALYPQSDNKPLMQKYFCDCEGGSDMFGVYIEYPDNCEIEVDDRGHYYNVNIKITDKVVQETMRKNLYQVIGDGDGAK